ncbi:Trm112 family protein [Arthrobacter sp. Sr24]
MVKINEDLLAILRCPVTRSPLKQLGEELISSANGEDGQPLRYTIDEGIALLLRPEQITA